MSWTDPRTWLAGEKPTAAVLNAHIRDNFKAIGDAWTAFTPSWTGTTTNPVIGNGTITGNYIVAGKYCTFRIRIVAGSTTTYGSGAYRLTYPFSAAVVVNPGISGYFLDSSGSQPFAIVATGLSVTTLRMVMSSSNSFMSNLVPVTMATSDEINLGGTFELA